MLVAAKQLNRRKVRLASGPLYGDGRTETFVSTTGTMVKLFARETNTGTIEEEVRNTISVVHSGVQTPDIQEYLVEDVATSRFGVELEKTEGETLDVVLNRDITNIKRYLRVLVDVQQNFHKIQAGPELPCQLDFLCRGIKAGTVLSLKARKKAVDLVKTLPRGNQICHGDSHPGNVLVTQGAPIAVSWVDANRGNPMADVARTELLFLTDDKSEGALFRLACRYSSRAYRKEYLGRTPCDAKEYQAWLAVNAAYRLREDLSDKHIAILKRLVKKGVGID